MRNFKNERQAEITGTMQGIGAAIEDFLMDRFKRRIGFAFITFELGPVKNGRSNYISNANRADMVKALREAADALDKGEVSPELQDFKKGPGHE